MLLRELSQPPARSVRPRALKPGPTLQKQHARQRTSILIAQRRPRRAHHLPEEDRDRSVVPRRDRRLRASPSVSSLPRTARARRTARNRSVTCNPLTRNRSEQNTSPIAAERFQSARVCRSYQTGSMCSVVAFVFAAPSEARFMSRARRCLECGRARWWDGRDDDARTARMSVRSGGTSPRRLVGWSASARLD